MHRIVAITMLGTLGATTLCAQPVLYLKARSPTAGKELSEDQQLAPKRLTVGRHHRVIQFAGEPTAEDLAWLESRGALILQYVPDNAVLVSAPDEMDLDWTRLALVEALTMWNKLSPEIVAPPLAIAELTMDGNAPLRLAMVELFGDVSASDARQIASNEGLRVAEHADLDATHMLVEGTEAQLAALAEWDEVAYIYPASLELGRGERVHACAGALTQVGAVGQYVARVGEGWDGPGLGAANLKYVMGEMSAKLAAGAAQDEIRRAMAEWSRVVEVNFTAGSGARASGTIHVMFATGAHADPYAFDGQGRVLAHTFYPAPPNPEPLAGDLHLDDAESWRIGNDVDLYSVVLHELGHAMGLAHSDKPGSVMYPHYARAKSLTEEDIAAVRTLYAGRFEAGAKPATPSAPPPAAAPSPAPAPPQPAAPAPTPSAVPDKTPPALAIQSPLVTSVLVYTPSITIKGSASDSVGVERVTWQSNVYGSGAADGTRQWSATVPLAKGQNTIIVRALDAAGNSSWRSLVVVRK